MKKQLRLAFILFVFLSAVSLLAACAKSAVQSQQDQTPQDQTNMADAKGGEKMEPRAEMNTSDGAEANFYNALIHFDFDSALLSQRAREILAAKADYLRANPKMMMMVEGHCDERGTDAYNIALGARRAKSAKDFLVDLGIVGSRLDTISYGEERPLAMGKDEESWAKNRRAQFVIQ